jgi:hypothetical protein
MTIIELSPSRRSRKRNRIKWTQATKGAEAESGQQSDRYRERLAGVLFCYDRVIATGPLPSACYAMEMTGFFAARHIRIFDDPRFAKLLRDRVCDRAPSGDGCHFWRFRRGTQFDLVFSHFKNLSHISTG